MQRVEHGNPQIIHVKFDNQYEMCSTMVRLQEYYESPFGAIQGHYFTLDEFMDAYAESKDNVFSYFTDWAGFNIPGEAVLEFLREFEHHPRGGLRPKEERLLRVIDRILLKELEPEDKFYLIATSDDKDVPDEASLAHELAHAFYYIDDEYRAACDAIYGELSESFREGMMRWLLNIGYTGAVVKDETQAYISTLDGEQMADRFGKYITDEDIGVITKYIENYLDARDRLTGAVAA